MRVCVHESETNTVSNGLDVFCVLYVIYAVRA